MTTSANDHGPPGLRRILEVVARRLAAGDRLLLLTDYDGTLTPIVRDPTEASLSREVRDALEFLSTADRVRVGIVSGRRLDDIRARVRLREVIYAGCHGLEIDGPGIAFRHPAADATRDVLGDVARALSVRVSSVPGVFVEPKGLTLAVHYRNAVPGTVGALEAEVDRMIRPRDDLTVLKGKKVIEILPRVGWNKGRCVLLIREHVRSAAPSALTTLYLGDDATDELAFRALGADAVTVRVGTGGASFAAHRLRDVADVHRLLSALAATIAAPRLDVRPRLGGGTVRHRGGRL